MTARSTFVLLLLAALLCLGACGDEDNPVVPPVITPPGYATPDLMLAAFREAYESMDVDLYGSLLHPDYEMLLQPGTVQDFPDVGATLDRGEEMRIAARMFGGQPVTDPDGLLVPGINSISLQTFEQQGTWFEVAAGRPFAGSQAALLDVTILCYRAGYSTLKVEGQLVFFAASNDTTIGGQEFTYWQLGGMQDLTEGVYKNVESVAWGSVKAMFWVAE